MSRRKRARKQSWQPVLPAQVPAALRSLARWAVWSTLGTATGCSSSSDDFDPGQSVPKGGQTAGSQATTTPAARAGSGPPEPRAADAWTPIGCDPAIGLPPLLGAVELARTVDYAGLYEQNSSRSFAAPRLWVIEERGTACPSPGDWDAGESLCQTRFAEARTNSERCELTFDCARVLITTYGDEVVRSEDNAALIRLLGAIDDPAEAALVAMFDERMIACPADDKPALSGTETRVTKDGFELRSEYELCGVGKYRELLHVAADGTLTELDKTKIGDSNCAVGRRPAGLMAVGTLGASSRVAALLAQAAHLEAASVFAFERLARELAALHAPTALVAEAARSALDEIRHARAMTALARRHGGEPAPAEVAALPLRDAFAIALENAVEGCVRESYGALVAHHQACTAVDPEVRAVMRVIADDEMRHAALAWRIAAWLEPQLAERERDAVACARSAALAQLQREQDLGLSADEAELLGWPSAELGSRLVARFGATLARA